MSHFNINMQNPSTIPTSTPSPITSMPSTTIEKSPYSPRTTINMNLRFLDRESKKQAELEYDEEHGADPDLVGSPGPEDASPPADQDAVQLKKRRKVRSAIVSRRKTAIYVEKLEADLNERENENKQLREKLKVFREVMQDIKDAIEATQGGLEPEPRTPTKRSRPSGPKYLPPVSSSAHDVATGYAAPQSQYASSYYTPTYPTSYQSQAITSHLPPIQTTQNTHQTGHITSQAAVSQPISNITPSFAQTYSQPQPPTQQSHFFLNENNNDNENTRNMFVFGDNAINTGDLGVLNVVAQHPNAPLQSHSKGSEYDADLISDCSDRMVSPVIHSRASTTVIGKRRAAAAFADQEAETTNQNQECYVFENDRTNTNVGVGHYII